MVAERGFLIEKIVKLMDKHEICIEELVEMQNKQCELKRQREQNALRLSYAEQWRVAKR